MSLNKVLLIGNVGREPEIRYVDSNMAVARLSLATSERAYTLKNGTQVPERTEWHRIVAWRETAQFIEKYVHTGDKLVCGRTIKDKHVHRQERHSTKYNRSSCRKGRTAGGKSKCSANTGRIIRKEIKKQRFYRCFLFDILCYF